MRQLRMQLSTQPLSEPDAKIDFFKEAFNTANRLLFMYVFWFSIDFPPVTKLSISNIDFTTVMKHGGFVVFNFNRFCPA